MTKENEITYEYGDFNIVLGDSLELNPEEVYVDITMGEGKPVYKIEKVISNKVSGLEARTIKKGTTVHINGIPLYVLEDVKMQTNPGNWKLIDDFENEKDETEREEE